MGTVAFLPWVNLADEVVIGGFRFKPININTCELPFGEFEKIKGIIKPYSLSPIYESNIKEFTLVYFEELGVLHDLDEEQRNNLFYIVELLKFTSLSTREYFTYNSQYFNANNFQLIIQKFTGDNFDVALDSRRRDGSTLIYTPGDQFKQFAPNNVNKLTRFKVDIELLKSLYSGYSNGAEKWEKIYDSILSFNLANTDSDMRDTTELILVSGAFEQLLGSKNNFMDFSEKFSNLFLDFPNITPENRDKVLGPRLIRFATDIRRAWSADLYQLRGGLAHGAQSARFYNSSWSLYEHLLLSSFIFPLVIKLKLKELDLYVLTEYDKRNIFSIDFLLSKEGIMNCSFRGDPATSNWKSQLSNARLAFIGRDL